MARLRATERSELADRAFAYVDSRGVRRLPIHDESHVRNALARFGQVRFEDDAARDRARTRLLQAAKRYRIVPVGFIANELEVARRAAGSGHHEVPNGFVTMLMTDVEGSTGLVERLGGRFGKLIDEVWAVLRAAVADARGVEVEARADEFFAVVRSTTLGGRRRGRHAARVRANGRSSTAPPCASASGSTAATRHGRPATTSASTSTSRRESLPSAMAVRSW